MIFEIADRIVVFLTRCLLYDIIVRERDGLPTFGAKLTFVRIVVIVESSIVVPCRRPAECTLGLGLSIYGSFVCRIMSLYITLVKKPPAVKIDFLSHVYTSYYVITFIITHIFGNSSVRVKVFEFEEKKSAYSYNPSYKIQQISGYGLKIQNPHRENARSCRPSYGPRFCHPSYGPRFCRPSYGPIKRRNMRQILRRPE